MPQAGINPPAQSHASYEASSLPPSHHGWITLYIIWGFFFQKLRPKRYQNVSAASNVCSRY